MLYQLSYQALVGIRSKRRFCRLLTQLALPLQSGSGGTETQNWTRAGLRWRLIQGNFTGKTPRNGLNCELALVQYREYENDPLSRVFSPTNSTSKTFMVNRSSPLAPKYHIRSPETGTRIGTSFYWQGTGESKHPLFTRLLYSGYFTQATWTVRLTARNKQNLRNLMLFIGLHLITWKIPSAPLIARLLQRLNFKAVKKCDIRVKTYIQGKLLEKWVCKIYLETSSAKQCSWLYYSDRVFLRWILKRITFQWISFYEHFGVKLGSR